MNGRRWIIVSSGLLALASACKGEAPAGSSEAEPGEPAAGGTLKESCREGVRLEHRIIEAVEAVLEHHEESRAQKVGYKVLRGAQRDEAAFEGCR